MKKRNAIYLIVTTLILSLIVSACGSRPADNSSEAGESTSSSGGSGVAAMPTASFKSVGAQSGITETIETTSDDSEELAAAIALGERVYGNKCAECHGPSGEGSDKGAAIAGTALAFTEFEDLLRTGGEIGPDHLFGTQAVSANGVAGLHAFLTAGQ